jgi:DNA polymerase III gamma/tau subunit
MSYTVLARKYRPQKFSEVIGQEHVTRTLQNAIEQGRTAATAALAKPRSRESWPWR